MRLHSAAAWILFVFLVTLFLTPLYSVYAQEGNTETRSTTPKIDARTLFTNIEKQRERLLQAKQRFDDRLIMIKEKIASREAQFKLRVEKFQDKVKADIATKVNITLNRINQNQSQQLSNNLIRMNTILEKVITNAGGTASQSAQVLAARSALETANTAVETQAGRDYTINISTESAIRKDAQASRVKLHADLKATRDIVIAAKQAVITGVRSILGGGEATKSALPATQSGVRVTQ